MRNGPSSLAWALLVVLVAVLAAVVGWRQQGGVRGRWQIQTAWFTQGMGQAQHDAGLPGMLTRALTMSPREASAHTPRGLSSGQHGKAPQQASQALLTFWNWRPVVLVNLALLGGVYVTGWRRLRRCGASQNAVARYLALYLSGLGLLGLTLLSPLDTLTPFLFCMHMIQHVLLMMLVPPLLLLANPFPVMLWGMPRGIRLGLGRLLTRQAPLRRVLWALTYLPVAWSIYVVTLWGWHHPAVYQAALRSDLVHDLEHLSFFGVSLLFWCPVINPAPRPHGHIAYGWRLLYVALAAAQNTILAALLSLTERVLYPYYQGAPRLWELSAIDDQAIGGVVMWISGAMMYLVALFVLAMCLLHKKERLTSPRGVQEP